MIKKHQKEEFLDQVTNVVVNFFKKKELSTAEKSKDDSQDFSVSDWFRGCKTLQKPTGELKDDSVQNQFRGCDTLSPVDELKRDFEDFFLNYGILEDDRPQIEYLFSVFINGVKCEGVIAVKANNSDEAFVKAQDLVSNGLFDSFPSLDIEYSVEPVEEDGYPLFRVESEKLPFSSETEIIKTSERDKAYQLFSEACHDNFRVTVSIQTSSGASSSVISEHEWDPCSERFSSNNNSN